MAPPRGNVNAFKHGKNSKVLRALVAGESLDNRTRLGRLIRHTREAFEGDPLRAIQTALIEEIVASLLVSRKLRTEVLRDNQEARKVWVSVKNTLRLELQALEALEAVRRAQPETIPTLAEIRARYESAEERGGDDPGRPERP